MKSHLLILLCLVSLIPTSFGQGEVFFANRIPGSIDARASISCGPRVAFPDSSFNADLAFLSGGAWFSVPGSVTPFRGTPGEVDNGYIAGFNTKIPGIAPGQQATLKMRGFLGPSFDSSLYFGETYPVTVTLGGGIIPVPNLDGLGPNPWPFICIPEPSKIGLAIMSFVILFLRQRQPRTNAEPSAPKPQTPAGTASHTKPSGSVAANES